MKRRNLFLSFVVIALLLIGLGYAAISDTLQLDVTATPNNARLDLVFVQEGSGVAETTKIGVTPISGSVELGADLSEDSADNYGTKENDLAVVNVTGLSTIGDVATINLLIKNNSLGKDMTAVLNEDALDAAVLEQMSEEEKELYTVVANFTKTTLKQGESTTLVITVTMKRSISQVVPACKFAIDLVGTYDMVSYDANGDAKA